ncbi:SMI1/KNR4 family protein [Bordetella sp. LUAb4]|uniref:SMI1/KNR4 family protein n=1 Tax=Bordetella sp. LUAb4 TaxID=2843195 RepID=UPI001E59FC7C|nr:SMI1/KNR4 family protein [Bordetella sp. LUAb4]
MNIDINDALAELKSVRMTVMCTQQLPDDALIAAYEIELGLKFLDDYKVFLKKASDSIFNGKDALCLTANRDSPRELLSTVIEAREQGVPESWLPICEGNGNYYCLLEDGVVRYWAHDGYSDEAWPNLATWIKQAWIDAE